MTDAIDRHLEAPEEGIWADCGAEVAVRVGDEVVGLGKALADMEARLMAAIGASMAMPDEAEFGAWVSRAIEVYRRKGGRP